MLAKMRGNSHAIRMGTIFDQTVLFLSTFVLIEERGFFLPVWRSLLLFIIIFESITIPLRLAFAVSSPLFLFWVELSIDVLFISDILINFCIAYRTKSGQLVKDRWQIARRYLFSWFAVDVLSAVPLEILSLLSGEFTISASGIVIARAFKLFRLLRLLRLLRLGRISRSLEARFAISSPIYRIFRFLCFFVIATHWSACMFYLLARRAQSLGQENWIDTAELSEAEPSHLFVTALYWSLTTITTIGYGDIAPLNAETRLFGIVSMIIGTGVFSYTMTQVVGMFHQFSLEDSLFHEKMTGIEAYMQYRDLSAPLRRRMREFFTYNRRVTSAAVVEEREMLSLLSRSLRNDVTKAVHRKMIRLMPSIICTDLHFNVELILAMETRCFPPAELLCKTHEPNDEVFILLSGQVERIRNGSSEVLEEGAHFGGLSLLDLAANCESTVRTLTWCTVRILSRQALLKTLQHYPSIRKRIMEEAKRRMECRDKVSRHFSDGSEESLVLGRERLKETLDEIIENELAGAVDPSQLFDDKRFELSRPARPTSVVNMHALKIMIGSLQLDQTKALLLSAESLLLRFTMQQTLMSSVGTILGKSWVYEQDDLSSSYDSRFSSSHTTVSL